MRLSRILLSSLLLSVAISCKKSPPASERPVNPPALLASQLASVQGFLKDSMPVAAYDSLDFTSPLVNSEDSGFLHFIRFPVRGIPIYQRFVIVEADQGFLPIKGAAFQIKQSQSLSTAGKVVIASNGFNGQITKTWLNGQVSYSAPITGGYIGGLQGGQKVTSDAIMPESDFDGTGEELPEIIITAPLADGGGDPGGVYSFSPSGLFGDGITGYVSSGAGGSSDVSISAIDDLGALPGINLQSYLSCFNTVSNAGAAYSVSVLVSIPSSNPLVMFNPATGHVGHAFLQLTKKNGTQSVTQYIGFYASTTVGGLSDGPTPSKLINNAGHPYSASYTINLNAQQFDTITNAMAAYADNDYSLATYNCVNYAVDVVNSLQGQSLTMQQMTFPVTTTPGDTPNALFIAFEKMSWDGNENVYIDAITPATAGASCGSCQTVGGPPAAAAP